MSTNTHDIEEALKPAGLYKIKSRKMKELSQVLIEKYNGDILQILNRPTEVARKLLLELPGVGDKTADILLSVSGKGRIVPIDTNINRIAHRIGIVPPKSKYHTVQKEVLKLIGKDNPFVSHLILIRFAWQYCKPINPNCNKCPVSQYCNYHKTKSLTKSSND